MALVQAFIQWHQRRMASHPYALNSAQSAVLMGIGDSVAQSLEMGRDEGKRYDPARLAILAAWAGGVNAPFWTWWNMALHRHWQGGRVAGWVLASASLSPLWNGLFFTWTTGLNHAIKQQEGSLRAKVQEKITTQLAPTVVKSCCLWVPFNFVRAREAAPPRLRPHLARSPASHPFLAPPWRSSTFATAPSTTAC